MASMSKAIGTSLASLAPAAADKVKKKPAPVQEESQIDKLLATVPSGSPETTSLSPGSTFIGSAGLIDIASDFHARSAGDLVTITVVDQASATSQGATTQARASAASGGVSSLFGKSTSALTSLANLSGSSSLKGQGATSRTTNVSTTVSARVIRVLPNGDLIVEGSKLISINAEYQTVAIRGIVRPVDLGAFNTVSSNQVENLEVRINGRGVINDAIKRPNFLYRLLVGILPF
jgi:flagellar L-ring protein FlgH